MACPFFYPLGPLKTSTWSNAPRVPLGALQHGECRARGTFVLPDPDRLTKHCNLGNTRGLCECFPPEAEADAFRFNLIADQGSSLQIQWVVEKGCWPLSHGTLEICPASPSSGNILEQQATAFACSYARRRDG